MDQRDTQQLNDRELDPESHPTSESTHSARFLRNISFPILLIIIAQLVLVILDLKEYKVGLTIVLLVGTILFLVGAILSIWWAFDAVKKQEEINDLHEARSSEKLTKTVFILSLLLASGAVVLFANANFQQSFQNDHITAGSSINELKADAATSLAEVGIKSTLSPKGLYLQVSFVFVFLYNLLAARASFKYLAFANRSISYLVFVANVFVLAFALSIIWQAKIDFGYADYPALAALFPSWIIHGLYYVAIIIAALTFLSFLVDHRNYRVGFFALSFLFLILILLLVNFTGFAYRHTRHIYTYYKGQDYKDNCLNHLDFVSACEIEKLGCPTKYLPSTYCTSDQRVTKWESTTCNTYDPWALADAVKSSSDTSSKSKFSPSGSSSSTASSDKTSSGTDTSTDSASGSASSGSTPASSGTDSSTASSSSSTSGSGTDNTSSSSGGSSGSTGTDSSSGSTGTDSSSSTSASSSGSSGTDNASGSSGSAGTDNASGSSGSSGTDSTSGSSGSSSGGSNSDNASGSTGTTTSPSRLLSDIPDGANMETAGTTDASSTSNTSGSGTTDTSSGSSSSSSTDSTSGSGSGSGSGTASDSSSSSSSSTPSSTGDSAPKGNDPSRKNRIAPDTNQDTRPRPSSVKPTPKQADVPKTPFIRTNGNVCLNDGCCGVLAERYTVEFLKLANFSLLTTLAACLVSIGCYYFWYVSWVDTNRERKYDWIWLFFKIALLVAFLVLTNTVTPKHIEEKLDSTGKHFELAYEQIFEKIRPSYFTAYDVVYLPDFSDLLPGLSEDELADLMNQLQSISQ